MNISSRVNIFYVVIGNEQESLCGAVCTMAFVAECVAEYVAERVAEYVAVYVAVYVAGSLAYLHGRSPSSCGWQ